MSSWQELDRELAAWRERGEIATLWCRDDDAIRDSPALRRLLSIAGAHDVPVALAAIPAGVEPSLSGAVDWCAQASVLQHGFAHRNHAPPDQRRAELGAHRPLNACIDELAAGRATLARRFGDRFVAVLVPPWNRIDCAVAAAVPRAGLNGLSTFGPRASPWVTERLAACNTHVDVVAWRQGRGFPGEQAVLERLVQHLAARRAGTVDALEPTGVLTHHLVLTDAAWSWLDELLELTRVRPEVRWLAAGEIFSPPGTAAP